MLRYEAFMLLILRSNKPATGGDGRDQCDVIFNVYKLTLVANNNKHYFRSVSVGRYCNTTAATPQRGAISFDGTVAPCKVDHITNQSLSVFLQYLLFFCFSLRYGFNSLFGSFDVEQRKRPPTLRPDLAVSLPVGCYRLQPPFFIIAQQNFSVVSTDVCSKNYETWRVHHVYIEDRQHRSRIISNVSCQLICNVPNQRQHCFL